MNLLVTGGCGFIGSHFVRWALANADVAKVTNLDALTYAGNPASLADVADDPRYRFVHATITDTSVVDDLVADADAVVNFAAETHVDRSIDGPTVFLTTNVVGTGVVLDACRRHDVPRVLHISTDEVYGSRIEGAFTEDAPMRPSSPYSASKAAADLLAQSYAITYDYPVTVSRTTNNYGPFHHPEKMIPRFITRLIDGGRVPLYGDGSNVRDWTYVTDNVEAQWRILMDGTAGEVYNVGSGNERSNLEVTMAILERMGIGHDAIEPVADRPGHDQRYAVDTAKVRALGWSPRTAFDDGLDQTIAWFRDHEDWWRPLAQAASERIGTGNPTP